ncbi:MAG: hypothetical protein EXQ74_02735 [Thermoleophilia bacterium]|nr:hypothetical protein [Thermoleophilia bacterium]
MPVLSALRDDRVTRLPRLWRSTGWLLLAALLGVVAVVVTGVVGGGETGVAYVLVARREIPPGTLIDETEAAASLAVASLPANLGLRGLISRADQAIGRRVVAVISVGEPLTQASLGGDPAVAPEPLALGERAVPVPLRSAGGPAIAPHTGARVDVLASDGEGLTGRTRIVVRNAEVFGVVAPDPEAGGDGGGSLVLRLTMAQALDVTRALDFAREVRVVTRPAGEP